MQIGVRIVVRVKRVGVHVVDKAAFKIDGPEWIGPAAIEDNLHGGLRTLGKNGGAVARSVRLATVAAAGCHSSGISHMRSTRGLAYTPLTWETEAQLSVKPVLYAHQKP